MSKTKVKQAVAGAALLLLLLVVPLSAGQVLNSGAQTIALTASLTESLSVNLSGNAVTFNLTAASPANPGNTGITATTTWNSKPGRNVSLYAYFNTAANALTDGAGHAIASAGFQISDNGGAFRSLTNMVPFGGAGAGLQLFTSKITGLSKRGTNVDQMLFNIDLSSLPQLPAGTYTGVLYIQAQVI